jgi:hypothetical protein
LGTKRGRECLDSMELEQGAEENIHILWNWEQQAEDNA